MSSLESLIAWKLKIFHKLQRLYWDLDEEYGTAGKAAFWVGAGVLFLIKVKLTLIFANVLWSLFWPLLILGLVAGGGLYLWARVVHGGSE